MVEPIKAYTVLCETVDNSELLYKLIVNCCYSHSLESKFEFTFVTTKMPQEVSGKPEFRSFWKIYFNYLSHLVHLESTSLKLRAVGVRTVRLGRMWNTNRWKQTGRPYLAVPNECGTRDLLLRHPWTRGDQYLNIHSETIEEVTEPAPNFFKPTPVGWIQCLVWGDPAPSLRSLKKSLIPWEPSQRGPCIHKSANAAGVHSAQF